MPFPSGRTETKGNQVDVMGSFKDPEILWDCSQNQVEMLLLDLFNELPVDLRPSGPFLKMSNLLREITEYMMLLKKQSNKGGASAFKTRESKDKKMKSIFNETQEPQIVSLPQGASLINIFGKGPAIVMPNRSKSSPSAPKHVYDPSNPRLQMRPGAQIPLIYKAPKPDVPKSAPPSKKPNRNLMSPMGSLPSADLLRANDRKRKQPANDLSPTGPSASHPSVKKPRCTGAPNFPSDAGFDKKHGLICQIYCSCPLNKDDVPLIASYKKAVFQHLRFAMSLNADDEVTKKFRSESFQHSVFDTVIEALTRREMHRFLKLLSPENKLVRGNEGWCIAYKGEESQRKTLFSGLIHIDNETYSVHQVLFKLFRSNVADLELDNLTLMSRKECKMNKNSSSGRLAFCINPWHFEKTDPAITILTPNPEHKCEVRIRLNSQSGYFVCPFCQQNRKALFVCGEEEIKTEVPHIGNQTKDTTITIEVPDENDRDKPITITRSDGGLQFLPLSSQLSNNKTILNSGQLRVKVLPHLQRNNVQPSIAPLTKNVQGLPKVKMTSILKPSVKASNTSSLVMAAANREEVTIKTEVIDPLEPDENVANNQIDFANGMEKDSFVEVGNTEKEIVGESLIKKEPIDAIEFVDIRGADDDSFIEDEEQGTSLGALKKKKSARIRCWKCLNWFEKEDLDGHSCLPNFLNNSVFCCYYCGICERDILDLKAHVADCQSYGLAPIPELNPKPIKDESFDDETGLRSRSKRSRKSDEMETSTKCPECGITFANSSELTLHSEKPKCKSIQCAMCSKFYANARTHQHHECDVNQPEHSGYDGIVVIKFNQAEDDMPQKCSDCEQMLRSTHLLNHHLLGLVSCSQCSQTFRNLCKLISHKCPMKK